MTNELADKMYVIALQRAIEQHCRGEFVDSGVAALCPHHAKKLDEAIAALRSEPVAWMHIDDAGKATFELRKHGMQFEYGPHPLYAAPSRETAKPEAEPALSADEIEEYRRFPYAKQHVVDVICRMALSSLTARDAAIDLTIKAFINRYGYDKDQYLVSMLRALKGGK